ncbi:MAG: TfoX/Sxy family protein [Rikenellaceae bacterium]|nr:TfoX/Sxy family protein [Rikenellaceae bacterium]
MACNLEFIEFVQTQLEHIGIVHARKMFGDYMIYVDDRAVALACDNCIYVKIHPAIEHLMHNAERGIPYEGAREHYILDIGHRSHAEQVISILRDTLPPPKRTNKI